MTMLDFRTRLDSIWDTRPHPAWSMANILQYQTLNQYRRVYTDGVDCPLDLCRALFELDNSVYQESWL